MMIRTAGIFLAIATAIFTLYFLLSPARVDPVPWEPLQPPPLLGKLAPNVILKDAEIIARGRLNGPEDIDITPEGDLVTGLANGAIVYINSNDQISVMANTGGRPLGLHYNKTGNLIIADGQRGLLLMTPTGKISVLTAEAEGMPFGITNDLDIAADGSIYFSDASWKWSVDGYRNDAVEGKPYGRLLTYNPITKQTRILLDQLYFANGVALSADEDFVLVCETFRYRIRRYWLKGPNAGSNDLFVDNLPGFPDGISAGAGNIFWVALVSPRNPQLDYLHTRRLSDYPRLIC